MGLPQGLAQVLQQASGVGGQPPPPPAPSAPPQAPQLQFRPTGVPSVAKNTAGLVPPISQLIGGGKPSTPQAPAQEQPDVSCAAGYSRSYGDTGGTEGGAAGGVGAQPGMIGAPSAPAVSGAPKKTTTPGVSAGQYMPDVGDMGLLTPDSYNKMVDQLTADRPKTLEEAVGPRPIYRQNVPMGQKILQNFAEAFAGHDPMMVRRQEQALMDKTYGENAAYVINNLQRKDQMGLMKIAFAVQQDQQKRQGIQTALAKYGEMGASDDPNWHIAMAKAYGLPVDTIKDWTEGHATIDPTTGNKTYSGLVMSPEERYRKDVGWKIKWLMDNMGIDEAAANMTVLSGKFEDAMANQMQVWKTQAMTGTPEQRKFATEHLMRAQRLQQETNLYQQNNALALLEAYKKNGLLTPQAAEDVKMVMSITNLLPKEQGDKLLEGIFKLRVAQLKAQADIAKTKLEKPEKPIEAAQRANLQDLRTQTEMIYNRGETMNSLEGRGGLTMNLDKIKSLEDAYRQTKQMDPELARFQAMEKSVLGRYGYGKVVQDLTDPDELRIAELSAQSGISPDAFRTALEEGRTANAPKPKTTTKGSAIPTTPPG
jgi:hypothetical protein